MNLAVINQSGKDTGRKVKLEKSIFEIEPNDHAIYLDVKRYMANQRQGTHKTKERGEIVGSTRKVKRQKGTGTARVGSIKSPILRGGGTIFGPRPKDYSLKLNKKVRKLARRSALSYKAREKCISVLEDFTFETPKTKEYLKVLSGIDLNKKKTLLVIPEANKNLSLSGRNLKKSKVIQADKLNTYDILNADNLVFMESSVEKINALLR